MGGGGAVASSPPAPLLHWLEPHFWRVSRLVHLPVTFHLPRRSPACHLAPYELGGGQAGAWGILARDHLSDEGGPHQCLFRLIRRNPCHSSNPEVRRPRYVRRVTVRWVRGGIGGAVVRSLGWAWDDTSTVPMTCAFPPLI